MTPRRIQLKRTKGWRLPPNTVIVDRRTRWGNPNRVGMFRGYTAGDAVADYRRWIRREFTARSFENAFGKPPTYREIRKHLAGKNLACWCRLGEPCHAEILLWIANNKLRRTR